MFPRGTFLHNNTPEAYSNWKISKHPYGSLLKKKKSFKRSWLLITCSYESLLETWQQLTKCTVMSLLLVRCNCVFGKSR